MILEKSFLYINEIKSEQLLSNSLKELADLEADVAISVKKKHDLHIKEYVTLIMAGNFDVEKELISQRFEEN